MLENQPITEPSPDFYLSCVRYYDGNGNNYVYYSLTNMQGDVLAFYGGDGKVRITYEYDAWGNTISVKNADGVEITNKNSFAHLNPIRYRGYYYDTETGLYYLNSRYYDPEIGRFINADTTSVVKNSPMLITDKNLFAYCDNNPITREDSDGEFWETALDVVSLAFSVADVVKNPSDPWAWAGLVGDAIDLVPFVTGVGEITRGVKLTKKAVEAVDDVHDAAKVVDNVTDIARKIDFYVTPSRDAIPASRKAFDDNISKLIENNGKFYGNDSKGPVRIRIEKHESTPGYTGSYNPFHCEWHFHIDRRTKGSSGPFKKIYTGLLEWLS